MTSIMSKVIGIALILLTINFNSFSQDSDSDFAPAEYRKGEKEMYKIIRDNLQFPMSSRAKNCQGLIYVSFTVNEKGKVQDVVAEKKDGKMLSEVVVVGFYDISGPQKEPDDAMNKAGVSAIKLLGKFNPAVKDGVPVSSQFVIPMKFKIQGR